MSRTIVLDTPRNARAFFEALVADNPDLGRPENVELIFGRAPKGRTGRPPKTSPPRRARLSGVYQITNDRGRGRALRSALMATAHVLA